MVRVFILAVFMTAFAFCIYLVYVSLKTGDTSGACLFGAFGLLFGIPLFVWLLRTLESRSQSFKRLLDNLDKDIFGRKPAEPRTTFVPHWVYMLSCLILVLVLLSLIFSIFKQPLFARVTTIMAGIALTLMVVSAIINKIRNR